MFLGAAIDPSKHSPLHHLFRPGSLMDKNNHRKPSSNTIRGLTTPFPLPPANLTTAVTTHTVSNSPENSTFPISRTGSQESVRTSVTFSRPSECPCLRCNNSMYEMKRAGGSRRHLLLLK